MSSALTDSLRRAPRRGRRLGRAAATALAVLAGACAHRGPERAAEAAPPPLTGAEASRYERTSTSAEVSAFVRSCVARAPDRLEALVIGATTRGRDVELVLAADPPVRTLEAAASDGRPVLLVMANIHGGEVEGKEATLEILREIAAGGYGDLLGRSIVAFVPNYNPDGNDDVDRRRRPDQAGPVAGVGDRANGAGLDLNRDYLKVEAPETEALIRAVRALDARLVVDCHATNGSFHGYDLTYAGPLHPGTDADLLAFVREEFLPAVRRRLADDGVVSFDYGNWLDDADPRKGWATFEPRPRFGNSYFGLRNRMTLLSEAYSHDPFEKRIASTKALVRAGWREFVARADRIEEIVRDADARGQGGRAAIPRLPTGSELAYVGLEPVPVGGVREEKDPVTGLVRQWDDDRAVPTPMPVYSRFDGTAFRPVPAVGWAVRNPSARLLRLLDVHGVARRRLAEPRVATVRAFVVSGKSLSPAPFQGVRLATYRGADRVDRTELPPGTLLVPAGQPALRLVFALFEPESEDGFGTWGVLGAEPSGDGAEVFEALRVEEM